MNEVVIVDAVRTPFGKRGGGLASCHSVELLADVLTELLARAGVEAASVGQVVGGCVGQIGMQAMNVARSAWLTAGLPAGVPASTVDAQCGSSQQAVNLAYALVAGGVIDTAVVGGVELMSRVALGVTVPSDGAFGKPVTRRYWSHHEFTSQFEGAERIAEKWGVSRDDCDAYAKLSQDRAAAAGAEGRFESQLVEVRAPELDDAGKPSGEFRVVRHDEGPRPTTAEALAALRPTGRADGVHTAGSSSQISDGASAALLMTRARADALGLAPLATIDATCLVGSDPTLMLTGPIEATANLLGQRGLSIDDLGVVEINEAFASVVLAWERELDADLAVVNPNGGAIALGHPLGATGCGLIAKAAHEMARTEREWGLVTMCCGGGLGTGTLLRRP